MMRRWYGPVVYALALCSFFMFFPGMMGADSSDQWAQASVQHIYNDRQPILMAWWWDVLAAQLWFHPAVLLLFHLLVFWSGVYALGRVLAVRSVASGYACLGLWFIPPVMLMTKMLWNESGMAVCWFCAGALMAGYYLRGVRPGIFAVAAMVLLLFYGNAVRYGAVMALLPLCYLFALCLQRRRVWAMAAALFFALCWATLAFDTLVPHTRAYPQQALMVYDIGRVSKAARVNFFPPYLANEYKKPAFGPEGLKEVEETDDPRQREQLFEAYLGVMRSCPGTYLGLRWDLFRRMTGIGYEAGNVLPSEPHKENAWVRDVALEYLGGSFAGGWFKGYIWLIAAMVMSGYAAVYRLRGRKSHAVTVAGLLSASGAICAWMELIIATGTDFRCLYWTVLATAVAMLLLAYEAAVTTCSMRRSPRVSS